jgi:phosphoribosylaminoimidazole-succinocarboxamide synthase
MNALISSSIESLPLVARGKVRDLYALGNDYLLMIATDRLSAYDVVMHEAVPDKGAILTRISNFWFSQLSQIIPNHLTGIDPRSVVKPLEMIQVDKRAVVVKKLKPILIEAVVRGYLAGSAWKEYQSQGTLSGHWLYTNLQIGDKLAEPLFTPASKEASGSHDENITYAEVENRLGQKLASQIKDISIELYLTAAKISLEKGMILADTKFEFGLDGNDQLVLMDEVLTPDSSRYWPAETYQPGSPPPSLDKQFLRDWLESTLFVGKKWNKVAPPPSIPDDILAQVSSRYEEVSLRLGIYGN